MKHLCAAVATTIALTSTVSAHHSPAAFKTDSQITIEGTVRRFDWTNPHVYIYLDTTSVTGEKAQWLIETDPTAILLRSGWTSNVIGVGTKVTVRGNPDRNDQRNHALLVSMALPSGRVLVPRAPVNRPAVRATSVAGVWDGMPGFAQRRYGAFKPSPRGVAVMQAYNDDASPLASCIPYPAPMLSSLPYLNQIDLRNDKTILIRTEFFNVDRTVYMDGRGHPANGPRTLQGHSIGRWEGDVLVVDTALFADHPVGNSQGLGRLFGLPSGPRKHLVERFHLTDDKTRLLIDAVLEDPDYLAEPVTITVQWEYVPQLKLSRFGCERESARRFTVR
jgi:hypothetical protein